MSAYGFRERYDDLNNAYRHALSLGNYTTQEDAMAVAVNMPSKRFWVSEDRLVEVINSIEAGRDTRVRSELKQEMYAELYRRYLEYHKYNPDLTKLDIVSEIIYQPAPKFYMQVSYALKILYRGRDRRPRKHHARKSS